VMCRNDLKPVEEDLGGRDRLNFGTVRPRVQIPGPDHLIPRGEALLRPPRA
jgi:hypothetical protein